MIRLATVSLQRQSRCMLLIPHSGARALKAFAFLRDPTFLAGVPILVVGLIYDLPLCTGFGLSLVACAMIVN